MFVFYLILTLNLILVVPVWRCPGPVGVVVVAIVAVRRVWWLNPVARGTRASRYDRVARGTRFRPVNLLFSLFYFVVLHIMFRLISLSGFLYDTINFNL